MPPKSRKQTNEKDIKVNKNDELKIVKGGIFLRELELLFLIDKFSRLEEKSGYFTKNNSELSVKAKEKGDYLHEMIANLTSEACNYDLKAVHMEKTIENLKAERADSHATLLKDLNELKINRKVGVDNLQSQLTSAKMQLQGVHEFTVQKSLIEQEIASLKDRLDVEKREHEEAVRDVERFSLQECEKLKREMVSLTEHTKHEMKKRVEEQLDIMSTSGSNLVCKKCTCNYKWKHILPGMQMNTKRTLSRNEQLAKEIAYHLKQRDVLALKNKHLKEENAQLEHRLVFAKELEEDLARKTYICQRATWVLYFKFKEKKVSLNLEAIKEHEQLKGLIVHNERLKEHFQEEQKELERLKEMIDEKTRAIGSTDAAEEAVKFLYSCLEDLDMKMLDNLPCGGFLSCNSLTASSGISLDQLDLKQRQDFLEHLLRTAISLRAVTQHIESYTSNNEAGTSLAVWNSALSGSFGETNVSVEDIMALKEDLIHLDKPVQEKSLSSSTTSIIQTDDQVIQRRTPLIEGIPELQLMPMHVINLGF